MAAGEKTEPINNARGFSPVGQLFYLSVESVVSFRHGKACRDSAILRCRGSVCARGNLEARGIDTFIQNEHHLNVAPFLSVALGGYRLHGLSEEKEAAARALKEISKMSGAENGRVAVAVDENVSGDKREGKNWLWLPIAVLSETPFLPSRKTGFIGGFQTLVLIAIYGVLSLLLTRWLIQWFR